MTLTLEKLSKRCRDIEDGVLSLHTEQSEVIKQLVLGSRQASVALTLFSERLAVLEAESLERRNV